MVSFYRLKYTNFISSDNYLVGDIREINPESRFLALGARKGRVIADLNYSCFLARRASLFLFGSLVRRSHPAVSFGYRFYDYEDLFSEFSSLSLSYVRDWVPGLLTNYKVLFRTALKEEGALRRIGFFFQFPDILLMFGANDSIGFIVNEARAIRIPTVVTGDASISFSRITYMLLSNYKSFKSTVFFVKLFLDLNAEALRFRVLRHYSIFKRFIKSIFLRRTLKSKLFSIKLARMFFIFRAVPGLRVSKVTPAVYNRGGWKSARFFKVPVKQRGPRRRSIMRRPYGGYIGRLSPTSRSEYVEKRRTLLNRQQQHALPAVVSKLQRDRLVLTKRVKALPKRKVSLSSPLVRLSKAKALKRNITRVRLLRRRRAEKFLTKLAAASQTKRLRKLATVAERRGLRVGGLLKAAELLANRLSLLNRPARGRSYGTFLPIRMVRRSVFRKLFPFFGYFAYGYMAKRLSTLFFYRAIFRQIIHKRKRVLRLKGFTSDLKVISTQAKRFRALNLAINRRRPSIWKLRARVKKFGRKLRTFSKLSKLRKLPGFNEKLYISKLLGRRESNKLHRQQKSADKFDRKDNKAWSDRHKRDHQKGNKRTDMRFSDKSSVGWPGKRHSENRSLSKEGRSRHYNSNPEQAKKAREVYARLMDILNKQEVQDPTPDKPKWLRDLAKINKESYEPLRKGSKSGTKKRRSKASPSKRKGAKLINKLASVTLTGNQRALVVRNFTPAQRHVLRLYRILSLKYPSFIRRSEVDLSSRRSTFLFPRTLRQFIVKSRRLKSEAFRKRTGRVLKFRRTVESLIPKPFKHRFGSKRRGGNKPWKRNKGRGPSGFNRDFKGSYGLNYNRNEGGKFPHSPDYNRKAGNYPKKPYYKPDHRNKDRYNKYDKIDRKDGGDSRRSHNPNYRGKEGSNVRGYGPDRNKGKYQSGSNASYKPDYRDRSWEKRGRWKDGGNLPYNRPDYKKRDGSKDGGYPKKPYGLDQNRRGGEHSKEWANRGNVRDTRSDKDVLNRPDRRKSKEPSDRKGEKDVGVVVTRNELPDTNKKRGKKGVHVDTGPQGEEGKGS